MASLIVAISREYGSGGRDVGRILADALGLPLFDKEIVEIASEKSGLSAEFIEKRGETIRSKFMQNLQSLSLNVPNIRIPSGYTSLAMATAMATAPPFGSDADKVFNIQSDVIREIAETSGGVIVGRCAGYVLKDHPKKINVFIRANFEDRVKRAIDTYHYAPAEASSAVKRIDKHRANYYRFYTDQEWGSIHNYDLVINTSYVGIEGAVEVIKAALNNKGHL